MAAPAQRILASSLLLVTALVLVAAFLIATGLGERLYFRWQGLTVGEPSRTWPVEHHLGEEPGSVRIAALGDIGTADEAQYAVADVIASEHRVRRYDALALLGDLVYPDGEVEQVKEAVLAPYAPLLESGTPMIPVLGNHDYESGDAGAIMRRLGRDTPWYAETVGPVLVVALDSNRVEDPDQTNWLRRTLDSARSPWTIVTMHHPAYSAGWDGSDLDVRAAWSDLFARYDVDLVLSGHDHDYQRSKPIDGVVYIVSGGGALPRPTGREDFTAFSASTLHYLDLQVTSEAIVGQAIDADGRAFDEFTLRPD